MIKLILITILIGASAFLSCVENVMEFDADFDLEPFRDLAKNANCADIANRLFLIDKEMVFSEMRGNCADAGYSFTLYGKSPNERICYSHDSIAGPQSSCQKAPEEMFNTMVENLDKSDLGLGKEHDVEEIPF